MNETEIKTRLGLILQGVLGLALKSVGLPWDMDHQYEPTCEKPDFLIPDAKKPKFMIEVHQTEARNSFQMKVLRAFTAVTEAKAHYGDDLVCVNVLFGDPDRELPANNVKAMCGIFDTNTVPRKDSTRAKDVASIEAMALQYAQDDSITTEAASELVGKKHMAGVSAIAELMSRILDGAKPNRDLFDLWAMERKRVLDLDTPPLPGNSTYYKRMLLRALFLCDADFHELQQEMDPNACSVGTVKQLVASGIAELVEELDGDHYLLDERFIDFLRDPESPRLRLLCKEVLDAVPAMHFFFEDIRKADRRRLMAESFLTAYANGRKDFEQLFRKSFQDGSTRDVEHARCWVADLIPLSLGMSHNAFNGLMFRHPDYTATLGNPFNNIAIRSARLGSNPEILIMYQDVALSVFFAAGVPVLSANDLADRLLAFRLGAAIKLQKLDPLFLVASSISGRMGLGIEKATVHSAVSDLAKAKGAGQFKLYTVGDPERGRALLFNAVATHEGNGDHKSKEWGARRLASLYRIPGGKVQKSEYQEAIFVLDGEWGDKDVERLYRCGWTNICRLGDLDKTLGKIFGLPKAGKVIGPVHVRLPDEDLPMAAEDE